MTETAEAFDARYENFFSRQDIDGWEIRKAMNDLQVCVKVVFIVNMLCNTKHLGQQKDNKETEGI